MPFTSEKQRRFMFAEHPQIAKRWAHENPEGDEGLPSYAHGETTSPELKKRWAQIKKSEKTQREETSMKYNDKGVVVPSKKGPFVKKTAGVRIEDLIKKAQDEGPHNVRASNDPRVSCMTCKYFTPLSGNRSGPGMCNVGSRPVPVKGTDVSDDYEPKV